MPKLTAKEKEERDSLAQQLREATTPGKYTVSCLVGTIKYYLLCQVSGKSQDDSLMKAMAKANFIMKTFPYDVTIKPTGKTVQIWVRRK